MDGMVRLDGKEMKDQIEKEVAKQEGRYTQLFQQYNERYRHYVYYWREMLIQMKYCRKPFASVLAIFKLKNESDLDFIFYILCFVPS